MKKGYKILQLTELEFYTRILRKCSLVPFPIANQLNKNNLSIKATFEIYNQEADLLKERLEQAPEEEKANAKKEWAEELKKLNEKKFEVELFPINITEFSNIDGEGEYAKDEEGKAMTYSHRDAFFNLIGSVIIE